MSRLCRGVLLLLRQANHPCHFIKVQALAALDYSLVVMVLPWGQHEQSPLSAGVKTATSWLGKGREPVLLKHNDGKSMLERCLHHRFFSWADAWRNENRSVLSL